MISTEYFPSLTISLVSSAFMAAAAIEGPPVAKLVAFTSIEYSPFLRFFTSCLAVAFATPGVLLVAALLVVGLLVVAGLFDVATTGFSSAANAKSSWSYASIAASAENIAVADSTFNKVLFFILNISPLLDSF